jgi:hypothetical protein
LRIGQIRKMLHLAVRLGAGPLCIILLAGRQAAAEGIVLSGEATSILRVRDTIEKKSLYPVYEYLNFSVVNPGVDGRFSFHFSGWGRIDLGDLSSDKSADCDLQSGYLSYRSARNNFVVNLGRQFIAEGIASERVDGAYLRSDFKGGIGAAVFVGAPVVTETNGKGGDLLYGGRITQNSPFYTLGISALKAGQGSEGYREEEGVDLWLHPLKQVEVLGRSSYNSITDGWMEHEYNVTYIALDNLSINAGYSGINYRDYFYHMTSNVFSQVSPSNPGGLINSKEKMQSVVGGFSYSPSKALAIGADYKKYRYSIAGDADYYGGKATFTLPGSATTGFAMHRMDATTDEQRYYQYRVFVAKKVQNFDFSLDFFDVNYDRRISGCKNSYTVLGAVSCELGSGVRIGADVDYAKNPSYDSQFSGLVKLTYMFDIQRGVEGSTK